MTRFRSIAFLSLIAASLVSFPAVAQDASPSPAGVKREPLFDVMLARHAMPGEIAALVWEELHIEPGVDRTLAADEVFTGRALYVLVGGLEITPQGTSMLWRGGAAIGGDPEEVGAGEPAALEVGDLLYLPYVRDAGTAPNADIRIANPGEEPARVVGFRLSDTFPVMLHDDVPGLRFFLQQSNVGGALKVPDGDLAIRLDRLTVDPGNAIQPDDAALATFYQVAEGRVDYTWTMPDGSASFTSWWAPRMGGWFPWADGVGVALRALSDDPAVILDLSVYPSGQ